MDAKKIYQQTDIKLLLIAFIERFKAGSPTDAAIFWVSKKPKQLALAFNEEYNQRVSNGSVKCLLKELGYGYRKQAKQLPTGTYAKRDEQFAIITHLLLVMSIKSPVISIDCKKKERVGNFYRDGKCYTQAPIKVYDHDYEHLSEGKVIPHSIYDLQANKGYICIGNSAETADFIIDNLCWWWTEYGIHLYPDATTMRTTRFTLGSALLLCDAGGANSYRHHIFKDRLLTLASAVGISFIVCHYPPYTSKWNPCRSRLKAVVCEHRLFCHVHQAMSGVLFSDYQTVKELMQATSTKTGLTVVVRLNLQNYQTGSKVDKNVKNDKRIQYHPKIPDLNYRINP